MRFSTQGNHANPDAIADVNTTSVPSLKFDSLDRQLSANFRQQKTATTNDGDGSESLQIFMDALFTALRDDPAACASVARITREIEAAEAMARAAAGDCPACGALRQHQRKDLPVLDE